jgi:hypothetical protein
MTTPLDRENGCIPGVAMEGSFKGRRLFLRLEDLRYAFLGSKAISCVRARWVDWHRYADATVYGRSRIWGIVRLQVESLKGLLELLGDSFESIESGVLVNVDAVVTVDKRGPGAGGAVGVLVGVSEEVPIVEELVASRSGRRRLMRRLAARWTGYRRKSAKVRKR